MKRYFSLLAVTLILSIGLIAQQGPGPQGPNQNGPHAKGEKLFNCLTILDLNEDQQTQIQGILESSRANLEAIREDAQADHQALRDAIDSGADECTVGAAFLEVHANRAEMEAFREEVKASVSAVLTPEQQLKLSGCLEAPGRSRGPRN